VGKSGRPALNFNGNMKEGADHSWGFDKKTRGLVGGGQKISDRGTFPKTKSAGEESLLSRGEDETSVPKTVRNVQRSTWERGRGAGRVKSKNSTRKFRFDGRTRFAHEGSAEKMVGTTWTESGREH